MSEPDPDGIDEFELIAALLRPLTDGAPEALGLMDDAAILPARPGFDLVISADAIVEGVHFLADDPLDQVGQKLLRVNLSDLAAKGAAPYAYFMTVCWPSRCGWREREAFAAGLRRDQDAYGITLFGGDTTSTPGPLTASATVLGWAPAGRAVLRSGARPGDVVLVSGCIGDGWLGLQAAVSGAPGANQARVLQRYRTPEPRTVLSSMLAGAAHAAADVSDGLVADAGRIAAASGVAIVLDLDNVPLSAEGEAWVDSQADPRAARLRLATGGDDYELVLTAEPAAAARLIAASARVGVALTVIGQVAEGGGVRVFSGGGEIRVTEPGYRHR